MWLLKKITSLYIIELPSKAIVKTIPLGAEAFTCLLSHDAKTLYISLWGGDKVLIFNTTDQLMLEDSIHVGDNPNELLLTQKWTNVYMLQMQMTILFR